MNQLPIDHEYPPELDDNHLLNRYRFHYNLAEIHAKNKNAALERYHRNLAERDLGTLVLRGVLPTESVGE
jgi:hypothetical protein